MSLRPWIAVGSLLALPLAAVAGCGESSDDPAQPGGGGAAVGGATSIGGSAPGGQGGASTGVGGSGGLEPACTGDFAYLHGDLWPFWYNFRVCCDAEHRALWRCESVHGPGSATCASLAATYQECLGGPNASVCPNWGVCCFQASNGCEDPDADHVAVCTTDDFAYDDPTVWGTYYGMRWSTETIHRFTTVKAWTATGEQLIAFSSNPDDANAYMEGQANVGVGPEPQGHIQAADEPSDLFGSFACIRLPAGAPLELQGWWINEFAHTCKDDYWSQPNARCWTDRLPLVPEAGRHYLWTHRGIELLPGCDGPSDILARLPGASCSTLP